MDCIMKSSCGRASVFRSINFLLEKLITGMYQTWSNEIMANIYTHLCCSQLRPHVLGFPLRSSLLTLVTAVWILQQSLTIHRRNCGNVILSFVDSAATLLAQHVLEELICCSLWSSRAPSSDSSPWKCRRRGASAGKKSNQSINNE